MGRAGYSDDYGNNWSLICWRGAVAQGIRGKRGQQFLRDLAEALDAMPEKRLIDDDLIHKGEVCAIGAVGVARGVDMSNIDPYDATTVATRFNISEALAREIMYENDEGKFWGIETPEQRWTRMRAWVEKNLIKDEVNG